MANTTWSATDKLNCTPSGLTVSGVTGAGAARTVDAMNSGKRYFEYTCTTWTSNCGMGVANRNAVLSTVAGAPANASFVQGGSGTIWLNGVNSGLTLGTRANGDIIGVAVDLGAGLIWYRAAPSGNWNGVAGANPATGVGGLSIAVFASTMSPLYGLFSVNSNVAQSVTANFGDSAFSGAVPAGFTGGFTAGLVLPTAAMATIATVEEFYTVAGPNLPARFTQVALEHWVSAAGDIPERMITTIVSLEEWYQIPPPIIYQVRAMVMA